MRVPLTDALLREARQFELRSSCVHCAHFVVATGSCAHGWPNDEQRRWPLDVPEPDGTRPETVGFCKEFELR